jgi:predicted DNA-binding transcriptional regulator AlpA
MNVESDYLRFLKLTGSPEAAATLVLAAVAPASSTTTVKGWLTAKDLSDHLGISVRSIYRRVSDGTLPQPTRIGRLVRWSPDGLDLQA